MMKGYALEDYYKRRVKGKPKEVAISVRGGNPGKGGEGGWGPLTSDRQGGRSMGLYQSLEAW